MKWARTTALLLAVAWLRWTCAIFAAEPAASATPAADYASRLRTYQERLASAPADVDVLRAAGELCHDAATREVKDAAALAEEYFRQLLALQPTNATARAWRGSALTLKARDATSPFRKLGLAKEGFREMDAAVAQAPDESMPRLVRGFNSLSVPKMFDRLKLAGEDLGWIHARGSNDPVTGTVEMRQIVGLKYGSALVRLKNADKAREVWHGALTLNPESSAAAEIRRELQKLGTP